MSASVPYSAFALPCLAGDQGAKAVREDACDAKSGGMRVECQERQECQDARSAIMVPQCRAKVVRKPQESLLAILCTSVLRVPARMHLVRNNNASLLPTLMTARLARKADRF